MASNKVDLQKARTLQAFIFTFGGLSVIFAVVVPSLSIRSAIALYVLFNLLATGSVVAFLITRHFKLVRARRRRPFQWRPQSFSQHGSRQADLEDYYLFVLGSGGHTKEMLMMMDDGTCSFQHLHRRYVVSSGDKMSVNHLSDYEDGLKALCERTACQPGSYDIQHVTRARKVHQPLLTTPLTALVSLLDIIFVVLLSPPTHLAKDSSQYPRMVFSNGPATGFFVGLAIHLLKMVYIIPEDRCSFVYIESWARISTLSLTGKLFHYTGIADAFAVQHKAVAERYGVDYAGPMVFSSRRETEGND